MLRIKLRKYEKWKVCYLFLPWVRWSKMEKEKVKDLPLVWVKLGKNETFESLFFTPALDKTGRT